MPDANPPLAQFIERGREERNLEYKGTRGPESFVWESHVVKAKVARTVMAMANIGGGTIVIGMDQDGADRDRWIASGVEPSVDAGYRQDQVQEYINQRADPFVKLALRHVELQGRQFVIIQVEGFDELPVVCTKDAPGRILRPGTIYTRSFGKHETAEVQTQSEMRELLDRAIAVGVRKRLQPVFEAMKAAGVLTRIDDPDAERLRTQGDDL